jgi:hypothetical protein
MTLNSFLLNVQAGRYHLSVISVVTSKPVAGRKRYDKSRVPNAARPTDEYSSFHFEASSFRRNEKIKKETGHVR